MTHTIYPVTFGRLKNVRKSGDEQGVYFADVEISASEGFPMEWCFYCARSDDYAPTGKWVYQQIIDGNYEGELTQLDANVDPVTGKNPKQGQPTVGGAETL